MSRKVSPRVYATCILFEGEKFVAYQDTDGVWTMGVGHTAGVKEGDTCTPEESRLLLDQDLSEAADDVERFTPADKIVDQGVFDALTDFVFCFGATKYRGSTLLKEIEAGDMIAAATQLLRWVRDQDGTILQDLVNRRATERAWFTESQNG